MQSGHLTHLYNSELQDRLIKSTTEFLENIPGCPSPTDSDVKRKVLFWVSGLFILNLLAG